jgi:type I restriction enzyme, S subunit
MAERYHSYTEYKDSEDEWIGKYPSNWNITRVKFESYVKARVGWHGLKSDDFTDEGPYLVTGSDFKGPKITWNDCYHCDLERYEQDPYIQLQNGDLLVTKDGTIGKVALVSDLDRKATLNSGVFVVRPLTSSYTSKFYFWLLQSNVFTGFVDFNKTGSTIVHLYQDTFVNFKYAMPGFTEQTQIANFLDQETSKIDTLIEKQQQLIKLLKEKRQAVISHAVTKGLNPDATMKDSGVEWLGEVPEHWKITRLKYLGVAKNGLTYSPDDVVNESEGLLVLRSSNIQGGKLAYDDNVYVSTKVPERMITRENDLLICSRNGSRALIGKNALITTDAVGLTYGAFMMVFRGEFNQYLYWIFNSPLFEYQSGSFLTSTINQLTVSNLGGFEIPLPSEKEQLSILEYLKKISKRFNKSLALANKQVELLQERRTALISAAVTGKIDVRNWQSPEQTQTNKENVI